MAFPMNRLNESCNLFDVVKTGMDHAVWRFVLISFVFLGIAFYVLSGGADYEPIPNSLQVQAKLPKEERILAAPEPEPEPTEEAMQALAEVETVLEQLDVVEDTTEELSLALTTTRADAAGILEAEANRPKSELLTMELPENSFDILTREQEENAAINAAVAAALGDVTFDPSQIRWVKENVVDIRTGPGLTFDRVTQITKGTEVAVLESPGHGWLKVQVIEGYQTGWVAEWLLMEPQ